MANETVEEVLYEILMRADHIPAPERGEFHGGEYYRRRLQAWCGGRLAEDFDDGDLSTLIIIAEREIKHSGTISIPTARIVSDDAYIYIDDGLVSLVYEADRRWKLRMCSFRCSGCFGDYSLWDVTCTCCGGTGWEAGNLEFCATQELPVDETVLISTGSPKAAFLHLHKAQFPILQPLQTMPNTAISPAIVRRGIAKLEIYSETNNTLRYLALMRQLPTQQWYLSAFLPLCSACGGTGQKPEHYLPCAACGGFKWGQAGDLRYVRHDDEISDWWEIIAD